MCQLLMSHSEVVENIFLIKLSVAGIPYKKYRQESTVCEEVPGQPQGPESNENQKERTVK